MLKVIEHKGCILIPCIMCRGVNFNGLRFEQVTYRHNTYIITAHNLDACRRLAKAGINVESGILRDYHWPSKYDKPFEHQKTTADFMVRNPRSFCFNDIGTSKTLTALWACDYLRSVGAMGKVLIVSTLSTLERVWEHEICTNILSAGCTILHGSTERRRKRLAEDHDYYIINHEGLKILGDELAARKDITHVIVDEGARFRNQRTDLWKALHRQACERSGRSVWWMTGSPTAERTSDPMSGLKPSSSTLTQSLSTSTGSVSKQCIRSRISNTCQNEVGRMLSTPAYNLPSGLHVSNVLTCPRVSQLSTVSSCLRSSPNYINACTKI